MSAQCIAFDVAPGNSGPARYVASLVRGLERDGWTTVHVESGVNCPNPVKSDIVDQKSEVGGAKSLVKRLVPNGAKVWIWFGREAGRIAGQINRVKFDLFHTQQTGCELSPVGGWWAGQTCVGTFHVDSTYDLEGAYGGPACRALEWFSNRCLDKAIAVSEATKLDWMRRTGIASERVVTIYNGIDAEQFRRKESKDCARLQLGLPQEALVLGGLGRLEPAKGFEYLVEALTELKTEFPQALVAIAGNGRLKEQLKAKAESLGVGERVIFLGFQENVNSFLDACDVFVMPSLCETLGYALLEAMAHELPAVGSYVGGIPEVIVPGETGFLAPARDGAALAKALVPLLRSAELRTRMGHAGRLRVTTRFREDVMVRKTMDVYHELLGD